ncbi:MAG: HAMP domain-containing protein, partial [Rhodothermales bacterium]|nr:HAMP domain-containing protein [Rhodothermales bacterium]
MFWRVAGVLVGAQVLTGLLAVGLGAYLWEARSLELVRNSLILRLDSVAEEVEGRAAFAPDSVRAVSRLVLTEPLRRDLRRRFPDPIAVLGPEGDVQAVVGEAAGAAGPVPVEARAALYAGDLVVRLAAEPAWALVPLYDPEGVPAGGLLVRPLTRSLERERAGTRTATRRALWIVGLLALASALALGAALTGRLVAPLRRMTRRVEALGAGDYTARLPVTRADEFGRLATAINDMAAQVEESFERLHQTDRLRRELLANVGHDLRTPLAALEGYLEEAERLHAGDRADEAAAALAVARQQGEQVRALVADLFELSVLDAP